MADPRPLSGKGPAKRYLALALAVALGLAAPVALHAQTPAAQILTLDQERLYEGSLFGKALEAKSLAATQALASENRRIEADLSAEEADLTEKRKTATPEAFQALADAFDGKVEEIRAAQVDKANQLKTDHETRRQAFFDAAVPVLADLMRQLGAYAILNHNAVILSFDDIDVTSRAIAAVDAKLGDGSKPLPQP